jgi:hypothetical protein
VIGCLTPIGGYRHLIPCETFSRPLLLPLVPFSACAFSYLQPLFHLSPKTSVRLTPISSSCHDKIHVKSCPVNAPKFSVKSKMEMRPSRLLPTNANQSIQPPRALDQSTAPSSSPSLFTASSVPSSYAHESVGSSSPSEVPRRRVVTVAE